MKLPLKFSISTEAGACSVLLADCNGRTVAYLSRDASTDPDQFSQDIDFIVRAVNSQDDLMNAVKILLPFHREACRMASDAGLTASARFHHHMCMSADAALEATYPPVMLPA